MTGFGLDREEINIDCECGATIASSTGEIRRSPTLGCPSCGVPIQVDGSDFDRRLRNVDRAFDNMDRAIRRIGQ